MKKSIRVMAGLLIAFEATSEAHNVHIPESVFTFTQHGWAARADAGNWTCGAYAVLR